MQRALQYNLRSRKKKQQLVMGWFGSSGDDKSKKAVSSTTSAYESASHFGGNSGDFTTSSSFGSNAGGDFQDQILQLSQQAMVQALMFKLTERGFEQCVAKPSSSLSSSEQSCMKAVTSKYMESSTFIMQRLQAQQK